MLCGVCSFHGYEKGPDFCLQFRGQQRLALLHRQEALRREREAAKSCHLNFFLCQSRSLRQLQSPKAKSTTRREDIRRW